MSFRSSGARHGTEISPLSRAHETDSELGFVPAVGSARLNANLECISGRNSMLLMNVRKGDATEMGTLADGLDYIAIGA